MRFSKQKGGFGALEAHHERTKEKYASNSDIDTDRSKYNIHIIRPKASYKKNQIPALSRQDVGHEKTVSDLLIRSLRQVLISLRTKTERK